MVKKLTRQQRRKLERDAEKGLLVPEPSLASTNEDTPAKVSGSSTAENTINNHSEITTRSEQTFINKYLYKPSSKAPCYLIGEGGTKTIWQGGWVPFDTYVEIANKRIGGGVYIGAPETLNVDPKFKYFTQAIVIDPDLDIIDFEYGSKYQKNSNDVAYIDMTPSDRGNYLEWLATGACNEEFDLNYMLLYFRGIEFRYFVEKRNQLTREEMDQFLDEIKYLVTLYAPNSLTTQFIQFERVIIQDQIEAELQHTGSISEEVDATYKSTIEGGLLVLGDHPLKYYHVVQLFDWIYDKKIATVREAVCYVFNRLFESKFNQQYPIGLKIDPPSELLTKHYTSLCQSYTVTESIVIADHALPNIFESEKLQSVAFKIGNSIVKDLKPYIKELQRNTENINRKKEIVFLPDGASSEIKSKADAIIEKWILQKIEQQDLVTYGDILTLFKTESTVYTLAEQWYRAIASFHRVGYGLAPDLMPFLITTDLEDEVVLFKYKSDFNDRTKNSGNFNSELFALTIGFVLIAEFGELSEKTFDILKQRVNSAKGLTKSETERLMANFQRMIIVRPNYLTLKYIDNSDYKINSKVIRESLKYYAEHYPAIISEQLRNIFYIYQVFKLDVHSIKSDLKLTGAAEREYQELLLEYSA